MIKKTGNLLGNRLLFICVLMVTLLFDTILLVHDYTGPLIKVFLVWGAFVILWNVFNGEKLWRTKPMLWLVLFSAFYAVTSIVTDRAYLVENIKTLAYMVVFFAILYGHDSHKSFEAWKKELKTIMKVFVGVTAVLGVVCLATFLFSIEGSIVTNHGTMYIGMCENRLWGLYNPNAGGAINLISIIFAMGLFLNVSEKRSKILLGIHMGIQYACLLLTGSRTALYAFILCIGMYVFFMANAKNERFSVRTIKGFVLNSVLTLVTMLLLLGAGNVVKSGLSYVPPAIGRVMTAAGIDIMGVNDSNRVELTRKEVLENREGGLLTGRMYLWKAGLSALKESPILGISKEATYDYAKEYIEDEQWLEHMEASLHNVYITVLVASGVIGLILFMLFLIHNVWGIFKTGFRKEPFDGYELFGICAVFVLGMLIIECTEARILYRTEVFNVMFWTICGYAYTYVEITGKGTHTKKQSGLVQKLGSHRFIKNTGWLIFDKILHMVMSLVVTGAVARYLGEHDYGIVNYGLSFVNIFTIITKLGIDSIIVNELVKNRDKEGEILGTTIGLRAVSSLLSLVSTYIFVSVLNPGKMVVIAVTMIESMALIGLAGDTLDFYFQSKLLSKYSALARTFSYPFVCLYRLAMVLLKAEVQWFGWATVFDAGLIAVFLMIFYHKQKGPKLKFSWSMGKYLLSHGKHFILANLLVTVYTQMDRLMLGSLAGQDQVGFYSAAMTIANLWIFIPNALIDSARPLIMELKANGEEAAYEKRWRQLYAGVMWLSILAGIFFIIFPKLVVWIIYGEAYFPAVSVLMILIWSRLFSLLGVLRSSWMLCEGMEKYIKYYIASGAIINVVLNYMWIPVMGANGAAVATLITEIVSSVFISMWHKKTRKLTHVLWDALRLKGIR